MDWYAIIGMQTEKHPYHLLEVRGCVWGLLEIYRRLSAAEKRLAEDAPLMESEEVFRRLRAKHGK